MQLIEVIEEETNLVPPVFAAVVPRNADQMVILWQFFISVTFTRFLRERACLAHVH